MSVEIQRIFDPDYYQAEHVGQRTLRRFLPEKSLPLFRSRAHARGGAARRGRVDIVAMLLELGIDVDVTDQSQLRGRCMLRRHGRLFGSRQAAGQARRPADDAI